jgi:phosphoribosylformimino-5-aminoimidazole carboxamide ribotide isomerase
MELLPAIDLRGGQAVRLVQGDFGREQGYGDPFELAGKFVAAGAPWLHVVDLDAARTGDPRNRAVVVELAARFAVPVQTGGGVRTDRDVDELLGAGIRRVVLGTAALEDPEFARRAATRHPDRVAIGLDYRRQADGALEAASHGWLEGASRSVHEVLGVLEGAPLGAAVVTAIERDGTLEGPDLDGLAAVLDATTIPVVASGGVGALEDVVALDRLRGPSSGRALAGAVVGKALADGRLDTEEAIAACTTSG